MRFPRHRTAIEARPDELGLGRIALLDESGVGVQVRDVQVLSITTRAWTTWSRKKA